MMITFMLFRGRKIILLIFFILLLINSYIVNAAIIYKSKNKISYALLFMTIICYITTLLLSAYLHQANANLKHYSISLFLAEVPVIFYAIFLLTNIGFLIFVRYQKKDSSKNMISEAAIKESTDNLPVGLCFATEKGIIILSNTCMENLSLKITNKYLQNALSFWSLLMNGKLDNRAKRIQGAGNPIIRFDDGSTWSFTRRIIEVEGQVVLQILAIDTTDLGILGMRLEKENEKLAKMSIHLQNYSKSIRELKSKEERFSTKMYLHDEVGYALLSTRYLLGQKQAGEKIEDKIDNILSLWEKKIKILQGMGETRKDTETKSLKDTAKDIGIKLRVNGKLPNDDYLFQLILHAAGECLANAVRHASATELYLDISETNKKITAIFTNNGTLPSRPIIEGGGLSALRYKVEKYEGVMNITHLPRFIITIMVPKEGRKEIA